MSSQLDFFLEPAEVPDPPARDLDFWHIAAEKLTWFDLLVRGYRVSDAGEGYPYDLLLDYQNKIYRIQVKTTMGLRQDRNKTAYSFGKGGHSNDLNTYHGRADIFALVAFHERLVLYRVVSLVQTATLDIQRSYFTPDRCDLSFQQTMGYF